MAAVSVFVCPSTQQVIAADGTPGCSPGAGSWQTVSLAEPWDPSQLNLTELNEAMAAGFIVMGVGSAICLSVALVVRSAWQGMRGS